MKKKEAKKLKNEKHIRIQKIEVLQMLEMVSNIKGQKDNKTINDALEIGLNFMLKKMDKQKTIKDTKILEKLEEFKKDFSFDNDFVHIQNQGLTNTYILTACYSLLKKLCFNQNVEVLPFEKEIKVTQEVDDFLKQVAEFEYALADEE